MSEDESENTGLQVGFKGPLEMLIFSSHKEAVQGLGSQWACANCPPCPFIPVCMQKLFLLYATTLKKSLKTIFFLERFSSKVELDKYIFHMNNNYLICEYFSL